jgi:parallel beta-helix repeat protein
MRRVRLVRVRTLRPKPSRPAGLVVLAIAAVLAALIFGTTWALAGGQHHDDHSRSSASAKLPGNPAACTGEALTPASNVQAAVNEALAGTTFCFGPGIYHVSSLVPKSHDVLNGENRAAILDGRNKASFAIGVESRVPGPSDVTIEGFVIQHFKSPLQRGAIQAYNDAGWIIKNNHITNNAAAGVATGDNVRVLDNLIDHNGQEGFSAHGNGGLYQGNVIAYNNYRLAVDPAWEAGGGKASATRNLTFRDNDVHNNGGPGLWADTNNIYTTFAHNTISDNWGPGIYEEISYDATIIDNTITGNGMPSSPGGGNRQGWAWDAGIQLRLSGSVSPSHPLTISGNIVSDNYNAISLIQSPPSGCGPTGGLYGPCNVQNVLVENNWITMTQGATGAYQDGAGQGIFTSQHNVFRDNHYCVPSAIHPNDGYTYGWFAWLNGWPDFSTWQIFWLQKGGTFTVTPAACRP